jgi:hypothetical protein
MYKFVENSTGNVFLFKEMMKRDAFLGLTDDQLRERGILGEVYDMRNDRADGMSEIVASTFAELLLHNLTSKLTLVTSDVNPDVIFGRTQIIPGAVPFTRGSPTPEMGFEKIIATFHCLGDGDYHLGNIMIANGRAVKIDHGYAFTNVMKNFSQMVEELYDQMKKNCPYAKENSWFSVEKYNDALKQMLQQLNAYQIEAVIDRRLDELKKAGFDPKGISYFQTNDTGQRCRHIINDYNDARKFFVESITRNLENMQKISRCVNIISHYSAPSDYRFKNLRDDLATMESFKNGMWLWIFKDKKLKDKDPILFAYKNGIRIDPCAIIENPQASQNNREVPINTPTNNVLSKTETPQNNVKYDLKY